MKDKILSTLKPAKFCRPPSFSPYGLGHFLLCSSSELQLLFCMLRQANWFCFISHLC